MISIRTKPISTGQCPGREHEQVIQNAEAELISLARQIAACNQAIASARSEMQALEAKEQAREQRMATARNSVETSHRELEEAQTRSSLQAGTMAAGKEDITSFEKQAKRAQTELTKLGAQTNQESHIDNQRRQVVQATHDNQQQTLASLLHRQSLTEQALAHAQSDLGQATLNACLEQLTEWRKQIEAKEQQLSLAREALADWGRDAVTSLADWPDLAATLQTTLPYEDSTVRVFSAAQNLVTVLLAEGSALRDPGRFFFEHAGFSRFASLDALLSLEQQDLIPILHSFGSSEPTRLMERKQHLVKFLEAYIAARRKEARR